MSSNKPNEVLQNNINNNDVNKEDKLQYINKDDNIFGLNFHQDEEDDENAIINSLKFSKFVSICFGR